MTRVRSAATGAASNGRSMGDYDNTDTSVLKKGQSVTWVDIVKKEAVGNANDGELMKSCASREHSVETIQ